MSDIKEWKTTDSKIVLDHPFFQVRADKVSLPSGLEIPDYTVWNSLHVVQVIPVTKDGKYVFTKQYKHGLGKVMLELPGGWIDEGEDVYKAAARELAEETNYGFTSKPEILGRFIHHPSKEIGEVTLFFAKDVEVIEHDYHLDETEDIEVVLLTKEEVQLYIDEGNIMQTGSMLGFVMTKDRI